MKMLLESLRVIRFNKYLLVAYYVQGPVLDA